MVFICHIVPMTISAFSEQVETLCKTIGSSLQSYRINELNQTQELMAARIGISRRTYVRMEAGDPTVKIGYWLEAAMITKTMHAWESLFTVNRTLFDELAMTTEKKPRQRATVRRKRGL